MSRIWNGKAFIDSLATRLWDNTTTFRAQIIQFVNEIQNELASEMPLDYYEFKLKKLIPTLQADIDLSPEIPAAPTAVIASGGNLTDGSSYKVYVTFVIYDDDELHYIESEPSEASAVSTADSSNKTISLTSIPLYGGATTVSPATIHRRIYVAVLASGETSYTEPFFSQDIEDNTTTTLSITAGTSSTITPPSDSEVDQISSQPPRFNSGNRYLAREDRAKLKRYDPDSSSSSSTPSYYDYIGTRRIYLYPQLSSSATTAERTLSYDVYRRPHEIFYDITRKIDLPIEAEPALRRGVEYLNYDFKDRDGKVSKFNQYEAEKKKFFTKMRRQKGRPGFVRDVTGDTFGFEV